MTVAADWVRLHPFGCRRDATKLGLYGAARRQLAAMLRMEEEALCRLLRLEDLSVLGDVTVDEMRVAIEDHARRHPPEEA